MQIAVWTHMQAFISSSTVKWNLRFGLVLGKFIQSTFRCSHLFCFCVCLFIFFYTLCTRVVYID